MAKWQKWQKERFIYIDLYKARQTNMHWQMSLCVYVTKEWKMNGSPKIDKRVCVGLWKETTLNATEWTLSVNGSGMSLRSVLSCGCNMLLKDNRAAAHVQSQRGGNSSSIRSESFVDCWVYCPATPHSARWEMKRIIRSEEGEQSNEEMVNRVVRGN